MFGAVRALHADLYGSCSSQNRTSESGRREILAQVVAKLAENMGPIAEQIGQKAPCDVEVRTLEREENCTPYAGLECGRKVIYVPGIWLNEFSELFLKNTDLRRRRGESFKKYSHRLYSKAKFANDAKIINDGRTFIYRKVFKFHLRNLKDSERAKEIIAFNLNHELAHLMRGDYLLRPIIFFESMAVAIVSLPIFYIFGLPWYGVLVSALVTGCAFKIWKDSTLIKRSEIQADLIALKAAPESLEGGVRFFKNLIKLEKLNLLPNFSHPATKERIAYLQHYSRGS